jgi:hypothetical protein
MYIAIVVIFINFVQILTDRFAKDTDDTSSCTDLKGYCGGTFNGIIQKLDYLEGMDRLTGNYNKFRAFPHNYYSRSWD